MQIRIVLLVATTTMILSCTASDKSGFAQMSHDELAAYNATVAYAAQVHCVKVRIRGTTQMTRTVCGTEKQLAQRVARSSLFPGDEPYRPANYPAAFDYRSRMPIIYYSPPPPGYNRPVIHIRDPRL